MGKLRFVNLMMVLALLLALVTGVVNAAPPAQEGQTYTVQKDDSLWAIAEKYLGNGTAYIGIVAATNVKREEDATFAKIDNPSLIQPGWKLYVPSAEEADEYIALAQPRQGGTLVVGMAATGVDSLHPLLVSDRPSETVIRNMFDGLVTRTPQNKVVLELAESMTWTDSETVEFKLKEGVTFHNGDPFTADDVVYTYDRVINEDIGAPRRFATGGIESVEKVDDYTVRFNLKHPWPPLSQMTVHIQIVPKKYLEEVGDEEFAKNPVGTGPFKFVEGDLSEQIVMERYDGYYGGANELPPVGPAFLDRVVFKMMPETSTRIAALLVEEVHIIQTIPFQMVPQLEASADVVAKTTGGTRPKFMDVNNQMAPFDDMRVRKALNYGVDAEALLEKVQGGYGEILPGPLSPQNNQVDPTLEPYGFDKDKALALLAEAGWTDSDGDGILDKEGQKFSMVIDAYGAYVAIAEAVTGQLLANLGIDATVRTWEYAVVRPLLLAGERQAFLRDWGDSGFDPVGYIEAKWHSRVEDTALGRANFALYSNPKVDELIDAAAIEPDPARRFELYKEMQRLIYDDAPSVWLYVPGEIEASSVKVQDWVPSPDSRLNMHDVWLKE